MKVWRTRRDLNSNADGVLKTRKLLISK